MAKLRNRFVDLQEVLNAVTCSRSTLFREIKFGAFPTPIAVALRRKAWLKNEVETVNAARAAGKPRSEILTIVKELVSARTKEAA